MRRVVSPSTKQRRAWHLRRALHLEKRAAVKFFALTVKHFSLKCF
jgi:hypothetical protein